MPTLPSGFAATPTPTFSFAVRLGAGPAGAASSMRVMLLASKTNASTAADNVPVEVFDV